MPEGQTSKFETSLPGETVTGPDSASLISKFLARFRTTQPRTVPSNVPTACVLAGVKKPDFLRSEGFLRKESILFFLESANELRSATPQSVVDYMEKREPWEDYDICLFDRSLQWCVGLTHNDDTIVCDPNGVFQ